MKPPNSNTLPSRVLSKLLLYLGLLLLNALLAQQALALQAFPGALGFGGTASGGRGGIVYHVTNLNDSGAGSFRDAVSVSGRIVVFDVGGAILLTSGPVSVKSNITIAGQTAPGGGISIDDDEVSFTNSSNIICRFIRVRSGGANTANTENGINLDNATNIIIDHTSIEFAKWNNIDATTNMNNVTVQNSILADPIYQQFCAHTEQTGSDFSWFYNLWVNAHNRMPMAKVNTIYVNNTVYNYQAAYTVADTSGNFSHDIINNYFITGPGSTNSGNNAFYQMDSNQSIYSAGNMLDNNNDGTLNGGGVTPGGGGPVLTSPWSPFTSAATILSAANAVTYDISAAGPVPRDQLDALIVSQVETFGKGTSGTGVGTAGPGGGLYGHATDTGLVGNGGFGVIAGGAAPIDSDQDGMPDDWEVAKGLNSNSAADANLTSATGYTNIEDYLNWAALPHAFVAKNTVTAPSSVDINLSQYANGFPASATYTITAPPASTSGTLTQSGAGGSLVHFIPAVNSSGLTAFTFSVTNGSYTLTSTAGVLVSQNPLPKNLLWLGDSNTNSWNTSTQNWTNQNLNTAASFSQGDLVTFDDTGSASPPVNLASALSPAIVNVDANTNNYTFSGIGSLAGSMALVKDGGATLSIANNSGINSYSGGTTIDDGVVSIANASALGGGGIVLSGGDLELTSGAAGLTMANNFTVNQASTLGVGSGNTTLNGTVAGSSPLTINFNTNNVLTPQGSLSGYSGTLTLTGTGELRFNNTTSWGAPGALVDLEGTVKLQNRSTGSTTVSLGAINGIAGSSLAGSDQGTGGASGTVTYSVGADNKSTTFAGNLVDTAGQKVALTKTGSGTLTLTGSCLNTGAITVSGGTLVASGTFSGSLGVSGGTLSLGTPANPVGPVTTKGFSGAGGIIVYDLSNSPAGLNDTVTLSSGNASVSGTTTYKLNFTNGVLGAGTYTLVGGSGTLSAASGTVLLVSSPMPATGTRQTLSITRQASGSTTSPFVSLTVTGNAGSLEWTGSNGGTWDLNVTDNWNSTTTTLDPDAFYNFDSVTFDDSASGGTVNLTGVVSPRSIVVNNTALPYVISGTGSITGGATLTMNGTGSLVIGSSNSFTGGIILNAGFITLANSAAAGTGTIIFNGGTLIVDATIGNNVMVTATSGLTTLGSQFLNGTLTTSGSQTLIVTPSSSIFTLGGAMDAFLGTIRVTGDGTLRLYSDGTHFNVGSANAFFDLGSGNSVLENRNGEGLTYNLGALAGGSNSQLQGAQTGDTAGNGGSASTYSIGALNTNTAFAGTISDGSTTTNPPAPVSIVKVGTGTLTLTGSSLFSGDVTIEGGTLGIGASGAISNGGAFEAQIGTTLALSGGTISNQTVQIDAGATLVGCGVINGFVSSQGTLLINCGGTLSVNGNLENDGVMRLTNGSQLAVSGTFTNTGFLDIITGAQNLPSNFVNTGIVIDASAVSAGQFSRAGSIFSMTIPASYLGHNYQLQHRDSLTTGNWVTVDSQAGIGDPTATPPVTGALILKDPNAIGNQGFYRVLVSP
jgi:autotransporter-associated beta strand protein